METSLDLRVRLLLTLEKEQFHHNLLVMVKDLVLLIVRVT
jgi:hypothetical protein